ncbi:Protein LCHN [Teratosphaeria destructans]|uniref:Protein LCHN n=1 Tax=Teratosphaeria destructans TaxID=418781 RepID=A0A9W7SPN5_9PEZI|nr:Protein LCHN [Teratosphaeria destructans]
MEQDAAPPVVAAFKIEFDQKVGYTLAWQRALPDVNLDGVEFKSLPSGLHGVKDDLVYFLHGHYAGISAFVQEEADEQQRNASFVAVGALVGLAHGKLGRSWLHAAELRRLAKDLVGRSSDARTLQLFWDRHRQSERSSGGGSKPTSPVSAKRNSIPITPSKRHSDSSHGFKLDAGGVADHPALYMPGLLDSFGPLIFPLYRAALLRKRILFLTTPPVQRSCCVVYILSVLASITQPMAESLQPDVEPLHRAHPLFSVGISDIPLLSQHSRTGWIATTTDDILGEKSKLWDMIVDVGPGEPGSKRRWPKMRTSDGKPVKATQRDLRRYRLLRGELRRMRLARKRYRDSLDSHSESLDDDREPLVRSATVLKEPAGPEEMHSSETEVVEPVSWIGMAYDSLMWWASAGDEEAWAKEEIAADQKLLDDLPDIHQALPQPTSRDDAVQEGLYEAQETATVMTAYFHRLTSVFIQGLASLVEEADDETEEGIEEDAIAITNDDIRAMGLDTWSENDKGFIKGMMKLYFGREAVVADGGIRLCGVRVC